MGGDVEIIFVPNGPNTSWRNTLSSHEREPRLRISPITRQHANATRNHGMELARCKYIRFLDDDDYLYPTRVAQQYETLERNNADVCAGPVDIIDECGGQVRRYDLPDTADIAAASMERNSLPTAYVFLKTVLHGLQWDETLDFNQDTRWMLDLVAARELHCVRESGASVGVWQQHGGARVSANIDPHVRNNTIVAMLDRAAAVLDASGRLTPERRRACANGVWTCAHMAFPFAPRHWSRVMRRALTIDPSCHSENTIYQLTWRLGIPPLAMEWLSLPERHAMRFIRQLRESRARSAMAEDLPVNAASSSGADTSTASLADE
ncbi:MAG: glycosyltransferase, partial [Lysobacteraceae bacterium]